METTGYSYLMSIFNASKSKTIFRVDEIMSAQTHVIKNLSYTEEIDCGWWKTGPLKIVQNPVAPTVNVPSTATSPTYTGDIPNEDKLYLFKSVHIEKNSIDSWVYLISTPLILKPV